MDQITSLGQLDTKPDIKTFEYTNGTLYYNYQNPRIDIVFKYPSNWQISEFVNIHGSNDKIISLELHDFDQYKDYKNKHTKNYDNYFYSYFPPILNILSYDLNFNNISLQEFAKIKIQDLDILFSDFKFNYVSSNMKYIGRENIPAWKFEYSVGDSRNLCEPFKDKRYGMNIWILNGDRVYEIEYIADEEGYFKNLREVTMLIDSIRFR
ncbi:MAG TPA: hypothetical protein VJ767_02565 [Nitrososphaeraceae archaeon]|nr:hypothetical protein [Nitrososphaeraceae archaeon]